ncbi:multidrug resistance-associated protein 1-like isoform X2 [Tachypleus tridentatus]|uniref:multidrug resistance-associated protein 1-like isoform X2 n=1 Tax=Tachypleus tridentatus TaxID=6853 RepID=UPI003FD3E365
METFCGSKFWDQQLTWNTTNPDLTPCFRKTVLAWIPFGFLWLLAPWETFNLLTSKNRYIPWTVINILKLILTSVLAFLALVELSHNVHRSVALAETVPNVDFQTPFLKLISFLLVMVFVLTGRTRGIISSGVQFFFWVLLAISGLVTYRSIIQEAVNEMTIKDKATFSIGMIYYPVVLVCLILSCFADAKPQYREYQPSPDEDECPEQNSSFLSRLLFSWFTEMTLTGWKRSLVQSDLWALNFEDKAENVVPKFDRYWQEQISRCQILSSSATYSSRRQSREEVKFTHTPAKVQPNIVTALWKTFAPLFVYGSLCKVLHDLIIFVNPQLLKLLIGFVSSNEPMWKGIFYAVLMFVASTIQSLTLSFYYHHMYIVGMRMRTTIISAIYRKAKQMKTKDQRIKLMNEVLNGIKVLKLYAWEEPFQQQILNIRLSEVQDLKKIAYLNAVNIFLWISAPFLVTMASFTAYVLASEENILDADRAFVSLSLFNIVRFPLTMLPMLISMIIQASVSFKRMNKYFSSEELDPYVTHDWEEVNPVVVEHGTFTWLQEDQPVLKNISVNIPYGALVAIVGQVGSGKSSLLSAILGDMEKLEGRVNVKGTISYVSQQSWIQNATIQQNILFGKEMNETHYQQVISSCALGTDLDILPNRDLTEVGEKGINLSGGQKQRICLARSVYNNSDIYILDDPLSAVDSHVGKHIFQNVIGPEGLLKSKTRLLVTHGFSFLPKTDFIIVMKDGFVMESGTYTDLLERNGVFAEVHLQYLQEKSNQGLEESEIKELEELVAKIGFCEIDSELNKPSTDKEDLKYILQSLSKQLSQKTALSSDTSLSKTELSLKEGDTSTVNGPIKKQFEFEKKLIQAETAETGEVKLRVYINYFRAIGFSWVVLVLLTYIGQQAFSVGSNIWLSAWSNDDPLPDGTQDVQQKNLRLGIYGALGAGQAVFVLLGTFTHSFGSMKASSLLHKEILHHVLHSPMWFFDTTPTGRIINRFSKDIDVLDTTVPTNLRSFVTTLLQVIAILFIISLETPIFLAVILPIAVLYYFIQKFYICTSRQLKRLESITRSPIFSHFSETLSGLNTIRAFRVQERFIEESNKRVDANQACYYPSTVSNRWLAIRLEFCGNCIVFFAALFAVLGRDSLSPGAVGLSVSYALMVTVTLNWMVRMSSELEANIVAVERICEYSQTPNEAPWITEEYRPPKSWPSKGAVKINQLTARYREGVSPVLKGVTCDIKEGEKVGIVGRTGAGKSSLMLTLFRIIEAEDGFITIDGIDISKIGLHDLRSKLSIIPQDPFLFSGTLRMNLDPFMIHSDEELWKAVEHSHLKEFVSSLEAGLDHKITEGGSNLSVGQRQLVCLARALLRKTSVLILDEATAEVDLETDDLVQATIRREFSGCTILTIAHRISTIMDYNRVMVLDNGQIIEFNSPAALLQDRNSTFYSLVRAAGLAKE